MRRPIPGPCAARAGQRRRRRFQSAHALLGRVVASRQAIRSASRLRVAMVAAGCDHAVSRPAPSWRSRFRSSSPKPLGRVDPHVEPRGVPVFMFQEGVTRLRRMPTARSRGSHVAHIAGSIPAQPTSSASCCVRSPPMQAAASRRLIGFRRTRTAARSVSSSR